MDLLHNLAFFYLQNWPLSSLYHLRPLQQNFLRNESLQNEVIIGIQEEQLLFPC
jgi:hypothetical protein